MSEKGMRKQLSRTFNCSNWALGVMRYVQKWLPCQVGSTTSAAASVLGRWLERACGWGLTC